MTAIRIDPAAAELRRAVGPVAWFVLEELLLRDGEEAGGAFIARASARSLAAAVSLNKDTVARALASLADAGVVELVPQSNAAGRFAAGRYRVAVCPGITRLDDVFRRAVDAPPPPHRPTPAPCPAPSQLTLLDVARPDSHPSALHALPDQPRPPDALAPTVPGRPAGGSRDGNVSAGTALPGRGGDRRSGSRSC